jgi:hypothetical protein
MANDSDSLCLNEKEFMQMKPKEQMCVLFQNQANQRKETREGFERMEKILSGYKFQQKVQYVLITAALAGIGILFKMHIGM